MKRPKITEEQAREELGLIAKLGKEKPAYSELTKREQEVCREMYQAGILNKDMLPEGYPIPRQKSEKKERRRNRVRIRLRHLWDYTWFRVFSDIALSLCMIVVIVVIVLLCVLIARH